MAVLTVGFAFSPEVLASRRYRRRLATINLLLFPELLDGGYAGLADGASPHVVRDQYVSSFREASAVNSFCCIAGTMVLASPRSQRTNTALVFERGTLIHRYDKIHLFRPAGDHRYFLPGKTIGTFRFGVGRKRVRAGLAICFDLRFPELVRAMAIRGMQILCVPSRWPEARDDAWQALLKARAIENQIFVLGCNAIGPEGGYSYAFDPLGNMLFSNRVEPDSQLCTFHIDLHRLADARRLYNTIREAIVLKQSRIPRVLTHRLPAGR